jgi:hypothetical protein
LNHLVLPVGCENRNNANINDTAAATKEMNIHLQGMAEIVTKRLTNWEQTA